MAQSYSDQHFLNFGVKLIPDSFDALVHRSLQIAFHQTNILVSLMAPFLQYKIWIQRRLSPNGMKKLPETAWTLPIKNYRDLYC